MISAVTAGVLLGLSAGLAPGPLLALVIAQTLKHGAGEGIKVALAPLITDLPIILVSLFLLSRLTDYRGVLGVVSLLGGLYVLYLAYESLKAGPVSGARRPAEPPRSVKKGSLVNALNPHPYLFWITVGGPFFLRLREEDALAPWLFMACFYLCLVGCKVLLALVVARWRDFLSGRGYGWTMGILAGLLALFACLLIRDALGLLGALPP